MEHALSTLMCHSANLPSACCCKVHAIQGTTIKYIWNSPYAIWSKLVIYWLRLLRKSLPVWDYLRKPCQHAFSENTQFRNFSTRYLSNYTSTRRQRSEENIKGFMHIPATSSLYAVYTKVKFVDDLHGIVGITLVCSIHTVKKIG